MQVITSWHAKNCIVNLLCEYNGGAYKRRRIPVQSRGGGSSEIQGKDRENVVCELPGAYTGVVIFNNFKENL